MNRKSDAAAFDAAIGLGSNVGDKVANIARAIELLTADGAVKLIARSKLYRSAPWGVTDQDWFVNAAITVATEVSVQELLGRAQAVENEMGRVRLRHWGPRVIDVDILTYKGRNIDETNLKVPHPLIGERGFVLKPLKDVAPEVRVGGKSIDEALAKLDASDVVPLDP